ncbi:hypothetical protein DO97_11720 [Neosynechococcus sphagnicola sy1]|uniref:DUF3464 domain-containing protein n=1 Tax=Neosynechococcus sphagnicola sy1 TaxID=1497020 RepID=A0A098THW5_9CYAN|nr:PAM68 family protein [Neosynechococcus sphagnicola]KGF72160.1 hypothetical protein DO97_11720 [Neosynechococcus sphagnicola sy1]
MSVEPQPERLPFEPTRNRQKSSKSVSPAVQQKHQQEAATTALISGIPPIVSQRMARRMVVFCGVPTTLGMLTFIGSYVVVSQGWFKLPPIAVLLVSLGFFGLGVVGLTYGVLSASWDEVQSGTYLGWEDFKTNWGRTVASWRSNNPSDPG